jgi:hypothetical protein
MMPLVRFQHYPKVGERSFLLEAAVDAAITCIVGVGQTPGAMSEGIDSLEEVAEHSEGGRCRFIGCCNHSKELFSLRWVS